MAKPVRPGEIDIPHLSQQITPHLPVETRHIEGVWLVGSFSKPSKPIDSNGESDVDVFLQVSDGAGSISCITGHYGTVTVQTTSGATFEDRPLQFLTSRQPGVDLNSFENPLSLNCL